MKYWFTPAAFNIFANSISGYKWTLLMWSALIFALYSLLHQQITSTTPLGLIWLSLAILFTALQTLVITAFIFFFQTLSSNKATSRYWFNFYRAIEWSEALLFTFLLPFPTLIFIYALLTVSLR